MRGADPTPQQLQVAADAMQAALEGNANTGFLSKALGPTVDSVTADYRDLLEAWDAEGWSGDSITAFAHFMDSAEAVAGPYVWNELNDLGVRRAQVGEQLRGTEGPPPTPGTVENAFHAVRNIAVNVGTAIGAPLDFLRRYGILLLLIIAGFLFLYLIRPFVMAYNARKGA